MNESVEIDIRALLKVLVKKAWLIVLCAVIAGAAFLGYTVAFVTPMYQASVTFYVNNGNNGGSVDSADLAVSLKLVNSYVNIIKKDNVLDKVIDTAGLNITTEQVRSMLTAEVVDETEMFDVKILSPDPVMSLKLANAVADVAPVAISAIINGSNATVVDYAKLPTSRHSPSYTQNTIIGVIVGAIGAVVAILICSMMDVHIKTEEDLMRICPIPVVGMIPDVADELSTSRARKSELDKE